MKLIIIFLLLILIQVNSQIVYDIEEDNCSLIKQFIEFIQYYIYIYKDSYYDLIRKEISQNYMKVCL